MTLRTVAGTPAYMAPEVMGICALDETFQRDSYTSAVDIWSLGQICLRIVTGEVAFSDMRLIYEYVIRGSGFPAALLAERNASAECIDFVAKALNASARKRLTHQDGSEHPWMKMQEPFNMT
jgi:serine/threonine protein kinase